MSCHYGCSYLRRCQGQPREEVIDWLTVHGTEVPSEVTDEQLNALLMSCFDSDYEGPDHVEKAEPAIAQRARTK